MKVTSALLGIAVLFTVGCGKDEDDDDNGAGEDLEWELLFTPAEMTKSENSGDWEASRVRYKLSNVKSLYVDPPFSLEDKDSDPCIGKLLVNDDTVVDRSGKTVRISSDADATTCLQSTIEAPKVDNLTLEITNATIKYRAFKSCDAVNEEENLGGGPADINSFVCPEGSPQASLHTLTGTLEVTVTYEGKEYKISSHDRSGRMTSDGMPCQQLESSGKTILEPCVEFSADYTDVSPELEALELGFITEDSFKKVSHGQRQYASKDSVYYESGETTVELGNWSGKVTYKGEDIPAEYEMAKGDISFKGSLDRLKELYEIHKINKKEYTSGGAQEGSFTDFTCPANEQKYYIFSDKFAKFCGNTLDDDNQVVSFETSGGTYGDIRYGVWDAYRDSPTDPETITIYITVQKYDDKIILDCYGNYPYAIETDIVMTHAEALASTKICVHQDSEDDLNSGYVQVQTVRFKDANFDTILMTDSENRLREFSLDTLEGI